MPQPKTQKLDLLRAYTHSGHTYGPGNAVDVPEGVADDLRAKEDEYRQYLAEGGDPHAPVTPSAGGDAIHDPRLRKPGTVAAAARTPGQEATAPHGTATPGAAQAAPAQAQPQPKK
jgi:hypothetical protein